MCIARRFVTVREILQVDHRVHSIFSFFSCALFWSRCRNSCPVTKLTPWIPGTVWKRPYFKSGRKWSRPLVRKSKHSFTILINLVVMLLKARLRLSFTHAFSVMRWAFEELTLLATNKVSCSKMNSNAINAFVNGKWKLG